MWFSALGVKSKHFLSGTEERSREKDVTAPPSQSQLHCCHVTAWWFPLCLQIWRTSLAASNYRRQKLCETISFNASITRLKSVNDDKKEVAGTQRAADEIRPRGAMKIVQRSDLAREALIVIHIDSSPAAHSNEEQRLMALLCPQPHSVYTVCSRKVCQCPSPLRKSPRCSLKSLLLLKLIPPGPRQDEEGVLDNVAVLLETEAINYRASRLPKLTRSDISFRWRNKQTRSGWPWELV